MCAELNVDGLEIIAYVFDERSSDGAPKEIPVKVESDPCNPGEYNARFFSPRKCRDVTFSMIGFSFYKIADHVAEAEDVPASRVCANADLNQMYPVIKSNL